MTNRYLRDWSINEQVNSMKWKFPEFKIAHDASKLKVIAGIRPTSRSVEYIVEIKYQLSYHHRFKLKKSPRVRILTPALIRNSLNEEIPHMYQQERLCLYQPKYGEFRSSDYISDTIIPWISLWLYHYENWHMTGTWDGGGEHPN